MVQPDPASTCYLKAYPEPAGRSRANFSEGEAFTLDSPRARGIIFTQVEATDNSSCHLTVLLSMKKDGAYYFYMLDGLGSVVQLRDDLADMKNSYRYDPFGVLLYQNQLINQPFMFAGAYYDDNTGFYKMGARYYDQAVGRFTQVEPFRVGESVQMGYTAPRVAAPTPGLPQLGGFYLPNSARYNEYTYVGGDPVNGTDPTGYQWQKRVRGGFKIFAGVAVAVVATVALYYSGGLSIFVSAPAIYGAVGMVFMGIEDVWDVNMPDLPLIP